MGIYELLNNIKSEQKTQWHFITVLIMENHNLTKAWKFIQSQLIICLISVIGKSGDQLRVAKDLTSQSGVHPNIGIS